MSTKKYKKKPSLLKELTELSTPKEDKKPAKRSISKPPPVKSIRVPYGYKRPKFNLITAAKALKTLNTLEQLAKDFKDNRELDTQKPTEI